MFLLLSALTLSVRVGTLEISIIIINSIVKCPACSLDHDMPVR